MEGENTGQDFEQPGKQELETTVTEISGGRPWLLCHHWHDGNCAIICF